MCVDAWRRDEICRAPSNRTKRAAWYCLAVESLLGVFLFFFCSFFFWFLFLRPVFVFFPCRKLTLHLKSRCDSGPAFALSPQDGHVELEELRSHCICNWKESIPGERQAREGQR